MDGAGLGAAACAAAAGLLLYRIARRKKPTHVTVNCWFCNQDTVVPYGNRNCWDCPNCEQYNGFQENGDYNKPIPAQYMEHLNHVVSGSPTFCDPSKPQQWVSSQILLCKKCNNHQTMKIKQLASFSPREEGKYDEEIEVYRHHLEQTYKLCRPCQAAVEYYIKHQNRQLRALLLSHHFRRRETDKGYTQNLCSSSSSTSISTPAQVILLRFLAFLSCAFLVLMALYGSGDPFSLSTAVPAAVPSGPASVWNRTGASPRAGGDSGSDGDGGSGSSGQGWRELLRLLPEHLLENLSVAWAYGKNHQMAVAVLGLLTCLLAMFLAGRIRLRRIDAFASLLWFVVMSLHLAERYLKADTPSWLDTAKFGTTSLCCLVGFTAAVATRKATGQRRPRPRRYLSGDSITVFPSSPGPAFPSPATSLFVPTPPSILHLTNQQLFRSPRRAASASLPGRLNRALSLGTIPSLARADSGYLFSGSRPASQSSQSKESPTSDMRSAVEGGSICSDNSIKKEDHSSHSSTCVVDTTTKGEDLAGWRGRFGTSALRGLLAVSLTLNAVFTSAYVYRSLR
ncbi:transmembrane protein 201 isoform X2 [Passer montanus]|uniref:transmembrane protein 201 isoform X2 n=1 Tax=Passer montanus TaxID=9160 RepID=UPI001961D449|nr:transmembrane protein 201 isoform X2 [Passer montanus]